MSFLYFCEDVRLQIPHQKSDTSFIASVIYRHSRGDVKNFVLALNNKLSQQK